MLVPVVMSPCELLLDVVPGLEGLHCLDDMQVWDLLKLGMLGGVEIFLCHKYSLFKEVLVDCNSVSFWHKHPKNKRKIVSIL